jgi:hypothetical protein
MCLSAICSDKFQVLQPGREEGMRLNIEDAGDDITTPGDKRSDERVGSDNRLFYVSLETFKTSV